MKLSILFPGTLAWALALPAAALAADDTAQELSAGDISYMCVATLLVLIMTPALGFFYGGLVRRKNTINTIMMSMVCLALITVQWFLFGYSLSFGPDAGGIIGNLDWAFFNGVGLEAFKDYSPTIPHVLFAMFQLAFAILTPAIVSGRHCGTHTVPGLLSVRCFVGDSGIRSHGPYGLGAGRIYP